MQWAALAGSASMCAFLKVTNRTSSSSSSWLLHGPPAGLHAPVTHGRLYHESRR